MPIARGASRRDARFSQPFLAVLVAVPPVLMASSFVIFDRVSFTKLLLPRLCKSESFESFIRQLNGERQALPPSFFLFFDGTDVGF